MTGWDVVASPACNCNQSKFVRALALNQGHKTSEPQKLLKSQSLKVAPIAKKVTKNCDKKG